ncbi:MAG TPA: cytochrome c family protein [Alphaproteobacteria bacterium]|nr:cytochrome c family protein [Alphaproteobacteria bacterium]
MNSFEFNKLFAAVLIAILVAMVSGFLAEKLIHPEELAKNAYVVEGVAASANAAPEAAAPAGPAKIEPFLAKADPAAGEKIARVCGTCHSFGKGEAAKIGPNLYGIIGSKHAHMAGFDYSDAMKAMAGNWDFDELNVFLFNPRAHIPGTKMTFAGIKDDQQRANVIAYLRTLSDSPVPLPK